MFTHKPPGSPLCWGRQHDDADDECRRCEWKESCRSQCQQAMNLGHQAPIPQAPLPQVPQHPQRWTPSAQPPPPRTYSPGPGQMTPVPPPNPTTPQPMSPPQHAQPQAPPQYQGMTPQFDQAYGRYPGESVLLRLIKHLLLTIAQVGFTELGKFFSYWRWPTKAGR